MEKRILTAIFGILIAVLGWIWSAQYGKLIKIEQELVQIKIELVRVQTEIMSKEDVRELIQLELAKRGLK